MDFSTTLIVAIVAAVILGIWAAIAKSNKLNAAKEAYEDSLERLKKSPTNANLKQETLSLGREYSNLTRDNKGNALFDEVALMNDINAVCTSAEIVQTSNTTEKQTTDPIEDRLRKLKDLKEKDLIDSNEYEKRRNDILNNI